MHKLDVVHTFSTHSHTTRHLRSFLTVFNAFFFSFVLCAVDNTHGHFYVFYAYVSELTDRGFAILRIRAISKPIQSRPVRAAAQVRRSYSRGIQQPRSPPTGGQLPYHVTSLANQSERAGVRDHDG